MIDGMLISEPSLKYIFLPQVILSLSWSTQADGKKQLPDKRGEVLELVSSCLASEV